MEIDLKAKDWYIQHCADEDYTTPVKIVRLIVALPHGYKTIVEAIVLCDDGTERHCRAEVVVDAGSYFEPAHYETDFEWLYLD